MLNLALFLAIASARTFLPYVGLVFTSKYWQRVLIYAVILPMDVYFLSLGKYIPSYSYSIPHYMLGAEVALLNITVANLFVFFRDPQNTLRKVGDGGKPEPFPEKLTERFEWARGVLNSPRYIGFTYSIPYPRPPHSLDPTTFILSKLVHMGILGLSTSLLWFSIDQLGLLYLARPVVWYSWSSGSVGFEVLRRLFSSGACIWTLFCTINALYDTTAIVGVALGSPPEEWPEFFGSIYDGTTVAKAWG